MSTVASLMTSVTHRLGSAAEARWIVAHALEIPPGQLHRTRSDAVSDGQAATVGAMTERRAAGEPLQYLLGRWAFRRLDVRVDARALIPRPETEQVVEVALSELRNRPRPPSSASGRAPLVVVDLGTGSGVIALSLALEVSEGGVAPPPARRPQGIEEIEVWGTDLSSASLELARSNLAELVTWAPRAAGRVRLAEGSWFGALPNRLAGRVEMVVSNPPYVSTSEWPTLDPEIRDHEPRPALVSGPTGLEALELLVDRAPRWLAPGGSLVLELAPHHARDVATRARRAGYDDVRIETDLAGRDRVLVARRPRD